MIRAILSRGMRVKTRYRNEHLELIRVHGTARTFHDNGKTECDRVLRPNSQPRLARFHLTPHEVYNVRGCMHDDAFSKHWVLRTASYIRDIRYKSNVVFHWNTSCSIDEYEDQAESSVVALASFTDKFTYHFPARQSLRLLSLIYINIFLSSPLFPNHPFCDFLERTCKV